MCLASYSSGTTGSKRKHEPNQNRRHSKEETIRHRAEDASDHAARAVTAIKHLSLMSGSCQCNQKS